MDADSETSELANGIFQGLEHCIRENEPLAPYTSLRLGGVAEYFAEPTNEDELATIVKRCAAHQIPVRLLGAGANVLVPDEGVPGMVIHLSAPAFNEISVDGNSMTAAGGTRLAHFVSTAVREGFSGPEQLAGIPGTIGGALHENTGSTSADIGNWVRSASVMTRAGEKIIREGGELNFAYRHSSLTELVILSAEFVFERDDPAVLTKRMQKLWIARKAQQPLTQENTAYVFKDHGGESARGLIENAGLKGTRIGDVEVSDRNANFFVVGPKATSADFVRLIELARSQVAERLSIDLETGIQIW